MIQHAGAVWAVLAALLIGCIFPLRGRKQQAYLQLLPFLSWKHQK